MEIAVTECIPVTDSTSVGAVRRTAMLVGQRLDFDETQAGELALLATEVSRNVLIHGGGGQVILAGFKEDGNRLARILALDSGPGIADIARALSDGYSTAGTMGGGLGAMKRMSSGLDIFTGRGGTVVLVEVGQAFAEPAVEVAGIALPYPGERICGDAWMLHRIVDKTVVLLVDGLGHGIGAADAAREATETFQKYAESGPEQILQHIHSALRKTRGAVAAVAEIRPSEEILIFAGIGNISAVQVGLDRSRNLVSHNGTLGAIAPRFQEFRSEWSRQSVLVMHSDGLQTRWDLSAYAGLISKPPAIIGATLLRDFRRAHDDASVVVIKGK